MLKTQRDLLDLAMMIVASEEARVQATVDPAAIWNYPERTLTGFTGKPRIDLLGEDASFEDGVGLRKKLIDRLAKIEAFDAPIEGEITLSREEQIVVLDEVDGNPPRYLEGYIDVSPLKNGDVVFIRFYVKLKEGDQYKMYYEKEIFDKPQTDILYIATKPARYGIMITARQVKGEYRTLTYQMFRRRVL